MVEEEWGFLYGNRGGYEFWGGVGEEGCVRWRWLNSQELIMGGGGECFEGVMFRGGG